MNADWFATHLLGLARSSATRVRLEDEVRLISSARLENWVKLTDSGLDSAHLRNWFGLLTPKNFILSSVCFSAQLLLGVPLCAGLVKIVDLSSY